MLERFTRERQRTSRGVDFNLEEEDELTHYGQSLSAFDDFDGTGIALDDEDDGAYDTLRKVENMRTHYPYRQTYHHGYLLRLVVVKPRTTKIWRTLQKLV